MEVMPISCRLKAEHPLIKGTSSLRPDFLIQRNCSTLLSIEVKAISKELLSTRSLQ
jgi:hypothetical protein